MSILSTISRGKRPRHIFALLYGTDGVGKTTAFSHAPNPVFIGAEKGTEQLDVARFPQTQAIGELLAQVRALQTEKHEFDSVVLDSLDWVEPLIWKAVCDEGKVETIEQYAGGYGKGYVRALDLWRTLLRELSVLNEKMHVLLIGHAQIKSFQDPELPTAYDRYQLKINDKAAALVREAADAVLFARFETELVKVNGSKPKARGEGNRIMYTESRPGWDAKNRFQLPFCMPLDWKTFGDAIRAFYGLSGKGNGAAKSETAPNAEPASESPERRLLAQVRARLEESKISEAEFLEILRTAQTSEANNASSLGNIPDKTLNLALKGWDTVVELARELRKSQEMSGVTQNQPVKVEIKGFKTSHFLEQKTAPRNCPNAGPMGHVERPQSEPSGNNLHLRRPRLVPAAYSPRAGDRSRDSGPVFAVSKTSHFDPRL